MPQTVTHQSCSQNIVLNIAKFATVQILTSAKNYSVVAFAQNSLPQRSATKYCFWTIIVGGTICVGQGFLLFIYFFNIFIGV